MLPHDLLPKSTVYDYFAQWRDDGTRQRLPPSSVTWTPTFFKTLQKGNLKKLDLERLFGLQLPTAQRMYRFLDKRYHHSPPSRLPLSTSPAGTSALPTRATSP